MAHDDPRRTIVHNFARWAAASSARQGSKVRGRDWYEPIDKIRNDLGALLSDNRPSRDKFAKWHETVVENLRDDTHEVVGWAAKILNMVTKVEIYLAGLGHPELKRLIHPPVDNILIDAVIQKWREGCWGESSQEIRTLCSKGKPINSIKTYSQYLKVIEGLRIVANQMGCSLFEVERLWGENARKNG